MKKLSFKKLLNFLSNNWLYLVLFVLIVLLYLPSLMIGFSLIDDAYTVKLARELIDYTLKLDFQRVYNLLFEAENGRVRPFYWIFQTVISTISQYNPMIMHLFRIIQLVCALYLIKILFTKIKLNNVFIPLSFIVYILNFQNFENYYRIGPAETFQVMLLGIVILCIFTLKGRANLGIPLIIFFSAISVFTKEQYFILFAPYLLASVVVYWGKDLKNKYIYKNLVVASVSTLLFGLAMLAIRGTYPSYEIAYSNHYRFEIQSILNNFTDLSKKLFHNNFPFIQLSLVYLVHFLYQKSRSFFFDKKEVLYILMWLSVVAQFVVLLPWDFPVERYLVVINYLLIYIYIFTFTKVAELLKTKFKKFFTNSPLVRIIVLFVATSSFAVFFVRNIFPISNFQLWQKIDTRLANDMLASLARNVDSGSSVYANYKTGEANIEIYLSTQWSLQEFHNRSDILFNYLDENNLCVSIDRFILDRISDRKFSVDILKSNELEVVDKGYQVYNPLTYGDVRKSFITGVKEKNWRVERLYDWTIYKQKGGTCIKI